MTYSVKEMYYTLQGEGAQTGRPAVFLRFAGCNLWSGREQHREAAICRFCDTDFVGTDGAGGGKYETAQDLAAAVGSKWPAGDATAVPYVVCTGGEPLLQLDAAAIAELHAAGFEVGVETNGTLPAPEGVDWLCVSPKGNASLAQRNGDELKLVYPQDESEAQPGQFEGMDFGLFYLQPLEDDNIESHTDACIRYCRAHPKWRLSLQMHKILGID